MTYYILVFTSFLQSVLGFTLISSSVMLFKEPIKKRITIGLVVMISGISLLSFMLYSQEVDSVNRIAILFILFIGLSWFLICSGDRFFVSFFSFLTFVNIYVSISFISDTLAFNLKGNAFVGGRIVIRLLIYAIIAPLLFKFVRPRFRKLVDTLDREWRKALWVPLLFLVLQIVILYYPQAYWRWAGNHWSRIIIIMVYMLFLAVYYLLYIQADAIVEKYALEKRHLLIAQQEKLWESELIRQKTEASLADRQRHDMHHHNAVIMGLLQTGDSDNLKQYMNSFDATLDANRSDVFCLNPIANSLMNLYASRAESENIKIEFHGFIPERIGIDNVDLTCVLGNTLENALEGCLRLPKGVYKEIIVSAKYIDKRFRLQVINTCEADVLFNGELPLSKKISGGTGTKSILYTAERYDGTAGFSLLDGQFVTQIVLNEK